MNRAEFLRQLESLLQNISPTEREEALQYYNDYFDDAGEENEQRVIEALGNPAKVAENIKRDLYGNGYGDAAFQRAVNGNRAVVQYQQNGNAGADNGTTADSQTKDKMPTWLLVLLIVLGIFASPVILTAAGGILSVLVGVAVSWFSLIFAAGIMALALFACMVVLLVVAVMCVAASPLSSAALLGGALLCGGMGLLAVMLTVAMAGIATPAMFRGLASLWHKLVGNKKTA